MNKEQVYEVLALISDNYHSFDITQRKIDNWANLLSDQNPASVMQKAERHILNEKFPPTIAEIRTPVFKKSHDQIEHEKMLKENGLL
ncbi:MULTISPECIES: replicative helicase loader/inhibitor [Lentibacillus]|uniref:Replicative helicase inhibitor G39P N-terminal domain-containing protein n=2 Tax=Lentibacillus TaxID=175304 RepID=A0A917PPN0_9BACI|nr:MULTISPECIES: replicative helicase loader/inhibitor [Lentibacillus]TFJ92166.1 hypothetical protein E4U82_13890 [Lentibacillus salicampi]GGJ86171.1 hypothetical protein GCM10007063_05850 [Lentibacillus kapialis]